jgi:hypothetical protein
MIFINIPGYIITEKLKRILASGIIHFVVGMVFENKRINEPPICRHFFSIIDLNNGLGNYRMNTGC